MVKSGNGHSSEKKFSNPDKLLDELMAPHATVMVCSRKMRYKQKETAKRVSKSREGLMQRLDGR